MQKIYSLAGFINDLESITNHAYLIFDPGKREAIFSEKLIRLWQIPAEANHTQYLFNILENLNDSAKIKLRRNLRKVLKTSKSDYQEVSLSVKGKAYKLGVEFIKSHNFQKKRNLILAKIINISELESITHLPEEKERQLNFLLHSSPDPVILTSINGDIIELNPGAEDFLGEDKHALKQKKLFDYIKNSERQYFDRIVEKTIQKSTSRKNYIVFKTSQNLTRHSETSASVIKINDTPQFIIFFIRDISDNILYQHQLEQEKRKAQESDRLKTAFLGNMSHEIRTPMNAIIGFAELLNDPETSKKERKEYTNLINTNSYELLDLIDDIIDVSKIEAGQVKIRKTICPLPNIIKQLFDHFHEEIQKNQKPIELITEIPDKYKSLQIYSDAYHLRQAIQHLLSNAIKFTEEGNVSFGYTIEQQANKKFIRFHVKDTGIGIPHDKQESIFQRFRQVEESNIKNYSGAGLGLTISKKLVELLGGTIGLTSAPGKGSEFYFTLPLETKTASEEKEKVRESNIPNYDWAERKILVAEDIEANYLYIEATLMQTNANLVWAPDGDQTAKKCIEDHDIDLVLMDIQLPGLNGYEATQVIKKHRPGLPVIALTAFAADNEKEKSLKAGCNDYLTKPVKPQVLLETINRFL